MTSNCTSNIGAMFAATCKNPVKGARSARQAGAEPQRPGSKRERREIIMAAKRPDFPAECAWQESSLRKVPAIRRWWCLDGAAGELSKRTARPALERRMGNGTVALGSPGHLARGAPREPGPRHSEPLNGFYSTAL